MKTIHKKEKNKTRFSKYEWIWYAQSYLSLARIGLEELIGRKYMRRTNNALAENNNTPGLFIDSFAYENKHLLLPIIYNLKSAIELALKSLGVMINEEFIKKHNTEIIVSELETVIKEIGLTMPKPKKLKELVEIANKYCKLEFWDKKLYSNSCVADSQNDIFRYPDNSANFILNLETFKSVSDKNIEELLNDIGTINSLLGVIGRGIETEKNPIPYKNDSH